MLPRTQPYQLSGAGETHAGLFEDVSTRSLETVRVGESAGKISNGRGNAFIGYEAGKASVGGSYDTFVGYQAGSVNTNSSYATMVGAYAGAQNLRGSEVTFVGFRAGELSRDGNQLVAVGAYALRENQSGNGSVAVGYRAGERTLDGYYNTMVGTESGQDNRSGNYNTMAGYRSGRAAFLGNENTYFGAFAGYSNSFGDGNSFIGYKSGEILTNGSYNVAVGAYSLQFAKNATSNVSIGPFAGANQQGNENVFVGANVAGNGSLNESVVIGTNAGASASGTGNVLIGHNVAEHLIYGDSNVIIGAGADTFSSTNHDSIAIGSVSTHTYTRSVAVGNYIAATREKSILVGNSLSSDSDNTVIIGNDISIQSVVLFKDPLNYDLIEAVLSDGATKLGLCNITYDNTLVSPNGKIYDFAYAGPFIENIFKTNTTIVNGITGPETYDLRTATPYYLISHDIVKLIKDYNDLSSNVNLFSSIQSYNTEGLIIFDNLDINNSNTILDNLVNVKWHESLSNNLQYNLLNSISSNSINIYGVIYHSKPIPEETIHNINRDTIALIDFNEISLSNLNWNINYNGINVATFSPSNIELKYVVTTPPKYGTLNHAIFNSNIDIKYNIYPENPWILNDSFTITPVYEIHDNDNKLYGIPSECNITTTINYNTSNNYTFTTEGIYLYSDKSYILSSNDYFYYKQPSFNLPFRCCNLDTNILLTSQQVNFTANDIAIMENKQIWNYPDSLYPSLVQNLYNETGHSLSYNTYNVSNIFVPNYFNPILDLNVYQIYTWLSGLFDPSSPVITSFNTGCNILFNIGSNNFYPSYDASNQYYTARNILYSWSNTYYELIKGSFIEFSYIKPLFRDNSIGSFTYWEDRFFNNNFYYDWSNLYEYNTLWKQPLQNQNILYTKSKFFDYLKNSSILVPDSTSFIQNTYQSYSNIYDLYFVQPRMFATYGDFISGAFSISNISDEITFNPIEFILNSNSNVSLKINSGKENVFTENVSNVIKYKYEINNRLSRFNTTLSDNNILFDNVFLMQPPKYGVVDISTNNNSSELSYYPLSTYQTLNDYIGIIGKKNNNYIDIDVHISYAPYDKPIINEFVMPYKPQTSNVSFVSLLFNTDLFDIPVQNVNNYYYNNSGTVTEYTIYTNANYNPGIGNLQIIASCNISTSNTISTTYVSNNAGYTRFYSNVESIRSVYRYPNTFNYSSNVTILELVDLEFSNGSDFDSNVTYWLNQIYSESNVYARNYTSNIHTKYHSIKNYKNRYNNSIIYDDTSCNVEYDTPYITVLYQNEITTSIKNTVRYFVDSSNYEYFDNYLPITKNHLYDFSYSYSNWTLSNYPDYEIIKSNVGIINTFNTSNITNGDIYIRSKSNSSNVSIIKYNNKNYEWKLNSIPTNVATFNEQFYTLELNSSTLRAGLCNILINITNSLSFIPEYLHIYKINNGSVTCDNLTNTYTIPCSNIYIDEIIYIPQTHQVNDKISCFFSSNYEITSELFEINLELIQNPKLPKVLPYSIGISTYKNSLTSNHLYYSRCNVQPSDIIFNFNYIPPEIYLSNVATNLNVNSFTLNDINNENINVYINSTQNTLYNLLYEINFNNIEVLTNKNFLIQPINYPKFPNEYNKSEIHSIGIDSIIPSNILYGNIWNDIEKLNIQGSNVKDSCVFYITKPLEYGFLWNSSELYKIKTKFTKQELINNKIQYIPYQNSVLSNEILQVKIGIDDNISQTYQIELKNYISRIQTKAIPCTINSETLRTIQFPNTSYGLKEDGYEWTTNCNLTVQKQNTYPLINSNIVINIANNSYIQPIELYCTSVTPSWTNSNINVTNIDQCDYYSLSNILSNYSCNIDYKVDDLFYITEHPRYGLIMNKDTGYNKGVYTYNELKSGNIIYQHLGYNTFDDNFKIVAASHKFDPSAECSINIDITPLPYLTCNVVQYFYYNTVQDALQKYNNFTSNILNISGGYLHVIETSNINVSNNTILYSQLKNNGFTLKSDFLTTNTAPYPPIGFNFTINNKSTDNYYNRLISNPLYEKFFKHKYTGFLNYHIDSNIILEYVESPQEIVYIIDQSSPNFANIYNKNLTISFQVQPQPSYINSQFNSLADDTFAFHIYDKYNNDLCCIVFENNNWYLTTNSGIYSGSLPSRLIRNAWNNIVIILKDSNNNNSLSIFWKYDPFISVGANQSRNLLKNLNVPSFPSEDIASVRFITDIYNNANFIEKSVLISEISPGLKASFDFTNAFLAYRYRNFEFNISSYTIGVTEEYDSTIHNVVVGKTISVRGTNNICIGNKFATSGQNSIILGNDIGLAGETETDRGTINDIYQSIIIGNDNFTNSIVRDVICIGRRNMIGLANLDVTDVQRFLSKAPVILGNDITVDKIDYHVNYANTLLKTSIGGNQIYLGHELESVFIGYSCNQQLTENKLYVNGNIQCDNIITNQIYTSQSQISTKVYSTYFINSNKLVSDEGMIDQNTMDQALIRVTYPQIVGWDPLIFGVSQECTYVTSGIYTGLYELIVSTKGRVKIWCGTKVSRGELMVSAPEPYSLYIPGSAIGTGYGNVTPTAFTFGKSLTNWNPLYPQNTPWVQTSNIGNITYGLIGCLLTL